MIGSQSIANQCQSKGLSRRVPYDVGRSIRMCSSTATVETDASIPNDALCASGGGGRRASSARRPIHTSAAVSSPSPTTPSAPCVGPRCQWR